MPASDLAAGLSTVTSFVSLWETPKHPVPASCKSLASVAPNEGMLFIPRVPAPPLTLLHDLGQAAPPSESWFPFLD